MLEFNISFWIPKKDHCDRCIQFDHSKDNEPLKSHLANKEKVRELKEMEKKGAKDDPTFTAACFDLEQVLTCPYMDVGLLFYKRKLSVYNSMI